MEKIYTVNRVDGFDPYEYLVPMRDEITGEVITSESGQMLLYLPVSAKKVWFKKVFPEGCVISQRLPRDDGQYEFIAKVYRSRDDALSDAPIGVGFALRMPAASGKYRPFESAQTLAEARALENAGFGSEVSLCLLMQEAKLLTEAEEKQPAPSAEQKAPEARQTPSLTVQPAEEAAPDDEALRIFEQLGVKGAGKSKKSRKTKAAKAEEQKAASDYVITEADAMGQPELDPFIGKSLAQLGKDDITAVLSLAEGKISEQLRKAAENYTKEAA